MIKVYQIQDQEALHPACTFTYGLPLSSAFKPGDHLDKYVHVADLDAKTLNEAFEVGNIGPEEKIVRHSDSIHSLSVGDILEVDGEKFIVARRGFDNLKEVI